MSLIRRFFGDDQNLKAANLESAPRLTLDLSGTQLTIPRPRQTVLMSGVFQRTQFALEPSEFDSYTDNRKSMKQIHQNGWDFFGKQERPPGYVVIDIFLIQPYIFSAGQSLFDEKVLKHWVMNFINNGWWAEDNQERSKLEDWNPDKHKLFQYPQSENEIKFEPDINGYYFDVIEPVINAGQAIRTYYCIPIDEKYLIHFYFRSKVVGEKYFSSEHNFAEASAKFIRDFMSLVTLKLSDEAMKQKQAAEQKTLANPAD